MLRLSLLVAALVSVASASVTSRVTPSVSTAHSHRQSRRGALGLGLAAAAAAALPEAAMAEEPTMKVYFGAGCFWHVQHEFVGEEVAALKRGPTTISAVSGYAGGQRLGPNGKVCYHNMQNFADYGKLGHAEAVQLEIPESELPRFCTKYFELFGTRGYRHDPQDRGGEYRSVLGLPGGVDSPMFSVVEEAAAKSPGGMRLAKGRGDEPDTIGDKLVLVYDSNKFPFYAGELYHQFHNDFMGPAYGQSYNALLTSRFKAGAIGTTGCPDMDPARI